MILSGALVLIAGASAGAAPPEATSLIDRRVAAGWDAAKVTPAAPADDAEFLRRVYLDIAGRIPGATEARQFLDSKDPDKREKLVEKLLNDPQFANHYANHFTNVWRGLLLPEANSNLQARFQLQAFEGWLREHLVKNTPYDAMVRELITAPINNQGPRGGAIGFDQEPSPTPFYFAKELAPENLAAATTRVFLGVKLECAQCHNHPFASWKKDEFWSFAAFFAGIRRPRGAVGDVIMSGGEDMNKREISIPNSDRVAKAKFLDGSEPAWKPNASPRETLAAWITRPDNPYFARASVNRMWAYFFGTGLMDPVDEMVGGEHTPSHPELLDELAKAFVESKFDLKFLIRAIVLSKPYQLSSRSDDGSAIDPRLFARMPLRGLTPAQLFDSLAKAVGYREGSPNPYPGVVVRGRGDAREEFMGRFGTGSEKTTEHQTSILHALALMNGRLVGDATTLDKSETLAAVAEAPFLDDAGKIEVLYLAALSRRPTEKETARLTKFIGNHTHGAKDDKDREKLYHEALGDVFWALLNSGEFMLNH
jgi:hypothetical protein